MISSYTQLWCSGGGGGGGGKREKALNLLEMESVCGAYENMKHLYCKD